MAAHVLQPLGHVQPVVQVVDRTDGVGHGALGVPVDLQGRLDRGLQVAQVVHGIEDAEDVDAVLRRPLDKPADHVIGIVPVAEDVLAAKEHLLRGVGHGRLQGSQALPGVLTEVADAGVESCAAPGLERPVADLVELLGDRQHVVQAHAGREQGLMGVAQDDLGNREFVDVHWDTA